MLAGDEIYDGAILLARPLQSGDVEVFEAILDTTVQAQGRKVVDILKVVSRDVERELGAGGNLVLRTKDWKKSFIMRAAPDGGLPTRYIVAPDIGRLLPKKQLPSGVKIVPILSTFDNAQLSDISFLLLEGLL